MSRPNEDLIERLLNAGNELREVITEAHQARKDLAAERKEMKAAHAQRVAELQKLWDEIDLLARTVSASLEAEIMERTQETLSRCQDELLGIGKAMNTRIETVDALVAQLPVPLLVAAKNHVEAKMLRPERSGLRPVE